MLVAAVLVAVVGAQHSKPVPDNSRIERNKFKQRDVSGEGNAGATMQAACRYRVSVSRLWTIRALLISSALPRPLCAEQE
jgi:hypothetical protein